MLLLYLCEGRGALPTHLAQKTLRTSHWGHQRVGPCPLLAGCFWLLTLQWWTQSMQYIGALGCSWHIRRMYSCQLEHLR